jgi:type II pantothenate kinase
MSTPIPTLGVDAGATLCKLALFSDPRRLQTALFPSSQLEAVLSLIESWRPQRIVATGGGADQIAGEVAGVRVQRVPEFDAWARGAPLLAGRDEVDLPDCYLLVSLGTGTSVLAVRGDAAQRVGGTALGGGTLVGLGRLLLQVESFREVVELAACGDRRGVDLLVGDIYRGREAPLPVEINAASFGKLASTRAEDLAHALIGLVGENIALICSELSRTSGADAVVYGGSTLIDNPALREILALVTHAPGRMVHFLSDAAFCGAVGAAALAAS